MGSSNKQKISKMVSYATGGCKTSKAKTFVFEGTGQVSFNGKEISLINPIIQNRILFFKKALANVETSVDFSKIDIRIDCLGGGSVSQAKAALHGVCLALAKIDASLKDTLRSYGLLTRDSRMVERKKAGLRKARRAQQFTKR